MALREQQQQRRAVWVAWDEAVKANGQAVRALNRARAESAVCAEAVYRLERLSGPQTAGSLRQLAAAWEAWDAATVAVIAAEMVATRAAVRLDATPRPGRASC